MYLLRDGGGGGFFEKKKNTLRLILMHFGGTYSHSVLARAQNGTAHFSSHNSEQTGEVVVMYN